MNFDPSQEKPISGCDSRTSPLDPFLRLCSGQRVGVCLCLCQFVIDSDTHPHPHRGTTQTLIHTKFRHIYQNGKFHFMWTRGF